MGNAGFIPSTVTPQIFTLGLRGDVGLKRGKVYDLLCGQRAYGSEPPLIVS